MNRFEKYQAAQLAQQSTFKSVEQELTIALRTVETTCTTEAPEATPKAPIATQCNVRFPTGTKPIAQFLSTLSSDQLRQLSKVLPEVLGEREELEEEARQAHQQRIKLIEAQSCLKEMIIDCYLMDCSIKGIAKAVGTTQKKVKAILTLSGAL